jgi:hypothetical protein
MRKKKTLKLDDSAAKKAQRLALAKKRAEEEKLKLKN